MVHPHNYDNVTVTLSDIADRYFFFFSQTGEHMAALDLNLIGAQKHG